MTVIFIVQKHTVIRHYAVLHSHLDFISISSPLAPTAREIQNLVLGQFGQLHIASPHENANNAS